VDDVGEDVGDLHHPVMTFGHMSLFGVTTMRWVGGR
jgi:hypothetical protein